MKTAIGIKTFDHALWISKLKNYKNEFVVLEEKLAQINSANPKKTEVLSRVEHFQNQFIVQKSNLNDILHAVKMDEREHNFKELTSTLDEDAPAPRAQELAKTFEKTMDELKNDFTQFAVKNHVS